MILVVGDIHANYRLFFERVAELNPQPTAILQVGDLGGEDKEYPDFPIPTYFIQGNHENWDLLYDNDKIDVAPYIEKNPSLDEKSIGAPKNLYFLKNGLGFYLEGVFILGFGGNYSSNFFDKPRNEIQQARRRHFNYEDMENCNINSLKTIHDLNGLFLEEELPVFRGVDILLTHEAPSPYMNRGRNCGIGKINEVIKQSAPRLHFFGHHHYDGEYEYESVKSYGLGMGYKTGMLLDPKTLEVKRISL